MSRDMYVRMHSTCSRKLNNHCSENDNAFFSKMNVLARQKEMVCLCCFFVID